MARFDVTIVKLRKTKVLKHWTWIAYAANGEPLCRNTESHRDRSYNEAVARHLFPDAEIVIINEK